MTPISELTPLFEKEISRSTAVYCTLRVQTSTMFSGARYLLTSKDGASSSSPFSQWFRKYRKYILASLGAGLSLPLILALGLTLTTTTATGRKNKTILDSRLRASLTDEYI